MTKLLIFLVLVATAMSSISQVKVNGYFRKNGTYVQPHYRSSPDGNPYNNYSYPGNYNPYTGQYAKGNPDTYLSRYYHIYPTYSLTTYNNYLINLCGTNYSGMEPSKSYMTKNSDNQIIGYVVPINTQNSFAIYDTAQNQIGTVKLSLNRNRFTVYSMDGSKVASNKKNIGWTIFGITVGVGLSVLMGIAMAD